MLDLILWLQPEKLACRCSLGYNIGVFKQTPVRLEQPFASLCCELGVLQPELRRQQHSYEARFLQTWDIRFRVRSLDASTAEHARDVRPVRDHLDYVPAKPGWQWERYRARQRTIPPWVLPFLLVRDDLALRLGRLLRHTFTERSSWNLDWGTTVCATGGSKVGEYVVCVLYREGTSTSWLLPPHGNVFTAELDQIVTHLVWVIRYDRDSACLVCIDSLNCSPFFKES